MKQRVDEKLILRINFVIVNLKNQIRFLAIGCIIILTGLISIQYYLVRNVYDLEKRNYVMEVKDSVAAVAEAKELDVLEDSLQEEIKKLIFKKLRDSIPAEQFSYLVLAKTDSIKILGNAFLKSQEDDYPILKELQLRYQFTEIIFRNDSIVDTILNLAGKPLVYFGKDFGAKESFNLSYGMWYNNNNWENDDEKGNVKRENYFLSLRHTVDVDISNWQYMVLYRMKWILIAAAGLLLGVILLFFQMYRALIKQKKIAEVKTDFANNITHELKTPLASLSLIVKSFQNQEIHQNPEQVKLLIQSLERQNERMQNIVDRVLESSVDKQKIQIQKVNITEFLREFTTDFPFVTHKIKTEIEPNDLFLQTDTYQLGRVIQNLFQNAEKYSPEGSVIELKTFTRNSDYIIEIKDEGKGIPPVEQKKIFEKFYRISEGNLHNAKGIGLGLYICKQIMGSLGGEIYVQSTLNKGSTFILKIPV